MEGGSGLSRFLMVATPFVAMLTLGVGLRLGASDVVRAAVVSAAMPAHGATTRAWPIMVFDDDAGRREPAAHVKLDVQASAGGKTVTWHGETNEDGAAELSLDLPAGPLSLQARANGAVVAYGDAVAPPDVRRDPVTSAWAPFARRSGEILLDVAMLGQRAASGFPSSVWVHATDAATHAPVGGATMAIDPDAGLTVALTHVVTDDRGWAHITATPLGYSVPLVLHATAPADASATSGAHVGNRTGEWAGGLFVSPGGSGLVAKELYAPDEPIVFDVIVPNVRTTAYVEIDDAEGRAWAAAVPLPASTSATPRATVTGPKLAPGLYWIAAAGDPAGAAALGPGTVARPFFVASSEAAALAFGTDPATCAATGDVRDLSRIVSVCLTLAAPTPVPRWMAVDGFAYKTQRDAMQRARGLTIALGAILLALVLETVLLLRAAAMARATLHLAERSEEADGARLVGRGWDVAVGVLLTMLGFALLGAFLVRLG
jgi:hypothetical protein